MTTTTVVGIDGTDFTLNGAPTYAGRVFEGHRIEGLLFNVRAVQATFDDANPASRHHWAYPDTGEWDPQRNVDEFCVALSVWRDHGVLAFTINWQGGGAIYTDVYDQYDNNGFTPEGEIKQAYAGRVAQILARADALGMVVIVGLFYGKHLQKMRDEAAIKRAGKAAVDFLAGTGRRNILIELANEIEICVRVSGYDIFKPERAPEFIEELRARQPGLLYSASHGGMEVETGRCMPTPALIESLDFLMPHGNGNTPVRLATGLDTIRAMPAYRANLKPILINEDSTAVSNLDVAWQHRASWGYYDQGYGSEYGGDIHVDWRAKPREDRYEELSGFQTPPVNWSINTGRKRAFFGRVAEVTGYPGSGGTNDK